jgi:predicted RND superfamily exporter protein
MERWVKLKFFVSLVTLSLVALGGLGGCSKSKQKTETISSPSKSVKEYYRLVKAGQFNEAYAFIAESSRKDIPKREYLKKLRELKKRFEIQEFKVVKEEVKNSEAAVTIETKELDKEAAKILDSVAVVELVLEEKAWKIKWPREKKD